MPRNATYNCDVIGDDDYHKVWGRPVRSNAELFAILSLLSQQGALAFWTVWEKRSAYEKAFRGLDMSKVAGMSDSAVEAILKDETNSVIHHRGKLFALRNNARVFKRIEREYPGGLSGYLWSFVPARKPACRTQRQRSRLKATLWTLDGGSFVSDAMAKELRALGVSHIGSTLLQAFLLQVGILNGHHPDCCRNLKYRASGSDDSTQTKVRQHLRVRKPFLKETQPRAGR
eukprot:TRINITY_DN34861_c0_g1_i1.p1 TRINITY_DN34861_c0_g1~~TRINITY_DN34861_c0_g1_i1.p1  ORF type:complete len:230 (-),score=19.02 TRINITY_DN34861_c0_g1_i1:362-1051(-)